MSIILEMKTFPTIKSEAKIFTLKILKCNPISNLLVTVKNLNGK